MATILIQTDYNAPVYMICIMISFIVGLAAAFVLMLTDKVPQYVIWCSTVLNALMVAFGGMMISVVTSGFKACGLSSVGGAFGVFAAIFIMTHIIPEYREQIFKAYGCMIPLMYSVSKLACHFSGCCYGREYSGYFSLHYEGVADRLPTTDVFPVQMSETILFAIIFVIGIIVVYVKKAKHGIFALACMCGIGKLLLDYLRDSHADNLFVPSVNQLMCLGIIVVGALLAYNESLRKLVLEVHKRPVNVNETTDVK